MTLVGHDLGLAYEQANACYALTFPERAAQPDYVPPFDVQKSFVQGYRSLLDTHQFVSSSLLESAKQAVVYEDFKLAVPTDEENLHIMPDLSSLKKGIRRTPETMIRTRDSDFSRGVRSCLAYHGLIASPEFQEMMKINWRFLVEAGVLTDDDVAYHNLNSVAFTDANEKLEPLILDADGGRRETPRTVVLSDDQKKAVRLFEEQLPEYVHFLNDVHRKIHETSPDEPPVFDIETFKKIANSYTSMRLYVDTHTPVHGLRYS